jgi:hypothetical protein
MMKEVTRFLVDKQFVRKDGKDYYKLFFYDAMDGVIVTILAPILDNTLKQMDKNANELAIEQLQLRSKQVTEDNSVRGD